MNTARVKHIATVGCFRLLSLIVLAALVLGPLAQPDAMAARPRAASDAPLAQPSGPPWVFQGPAPQVNAQQDLATSRQRMSRSAGPWPPSRPARPTPTWSTSGRRTAASGKRPTPPTANPTWTPLTDHLQSLSIGLDALALDPLDATGQTVIAGTGRFSGYANRGDDLVGLYYTTDGGATWTTTTSPLLSAAKITGVAARGNTLLAASEDGLFRSTGGPLGTWTKISGSGGLPDTPRVQHRRRPREHQSALRHLHRGLRRPLPQRRSGRNLDQHHRQLSNVISADTTAFDVAVYNDGATSVVTVVLNGTVDGAEGNAIFRSVNGAAFTALDVPFVFRGRVWQVRA